MIGPLEVLSDVVRKFEDARIDYFLVGSLASMYYGQPRFTNDIDLVVIIRPDQIRAIEKKFTQEEYYCPPTEILKDEVLRQGSFNLIHQVSQIKIDIVIAKNSEFYKSEISRKNKVALTPELDVFIASAEDIIIKKLDFFREGQSHKHLSDIKGILAETTLDHMYLDLWVTKLGLMEQWQLAKS